jgi:phenylalanyl-tRNA synthetase beta chain
VAEAFAFRTKSYLGEADVARLAAGAGTRTLQVAPLARFPAVRRDLAVLVRDDVPAADLEAALREAGGELLREARLFDVYRGDRIAAGTTSYAFALGFQAADRTLRDDEADAAQARIVEALRARFGATLRGGAGC